MRLVRFVHPILLFFKGGGGWGHHEFDIVFFPVVCFHQNLVCKGGVEKESGIGTLKASALDERV